MELFEHFKPEVCLFIAESIKITQVGKANATSLDPHVQGKADQSVDERASKFIPGELGQYMEADASLITYAKGLAEHSTREQHRASGKV